MEGYAKEMTAEHHCTGEEKQMNAINNTVKYRTLKEQKAIEKSGRKYQSQHSLWKEYTFSYEAFDLPKTGSIKIMARSEQEAYTKAEKQIQDDGYYHVELY